MGEINLTDHIHSGRETYSKAPEWEGGCMFDFVKITTVLYHININNNLTSAKDSRGWAGGRQLDTVIKYRVMGLFFFPRIFLFFWNATKHQNEIETHRNVSRG